MAGYPKDLKYTKDHEWARQVGKAIAVGVTAYAQESLGDVVYVELPKLGAAVKAGTPFGVIESTKAVSELFAPVNGKVVKVNDALVKDPTLVNKDPYAAWIIEIEPSDAQQVAGLLDAAAYEKIVASAAG
jgi:glycine cleavage system H protein